MDDTKSPVETQEKGKRAEFYVFGELLKLSADLYLPVIDQGVDAIVRKRNGECIEIQVKGTEAAEQAGYFNVYGLDQQLRESFYIVCVDLNRDTVKYVEGGSWPNSWVLPARVYQEYKTGRDRAHLAIYDNSRRHGNRPRFKLLKYYYKAWHLLT